MIAVLDYGMGNIRSVLNAFRYVGHEPTPTADPRDLRDARAVVLPGVGAFGAAMENLRKRDLIEGLERAVRENGKPFLGICVGMQLVAECSSEGGECAGLGWVSGSVERIPENVSDGIRVPHIGWNEVGFDRDDPILEGLGSGQDFYFVHSYRFVTAADEVALGSCEHGGEIVAIIGHENIHAVQFHPEKSHRAGLSLLRNWCERVVGC